MTNPMNTGRIAILGASSSLGIALCRQLAAEGNALVLIGRNPDALSAQANDLRIRAGVAVDIVPCDLTKSVESIAEAVSSTGETDAFFCIAGDMGTGNKDDLADIAQVIQVNFSAPAQFLTAIAAQYEQRNEQGNEQGKRGGGIVVISSVAGDRGRQSNYPYGSAKAALTTFASGLRNRLFRSGIHVMTVKPGFLDTPMTYGMNSPLICDRDVAAASILRAWKRKKDTIYVPFFWRWIMLIICHIPERVFKKLKL